MLRTTLMAAAGGLALFAAPALAQTTMAPAPAPSSQPPASPMNQSSTQTPAMADDSAGSASGQSGSMGQQGSMGGTTPASMGTPADRAGFTPTVPQGTEEQVVSSGSVQTQTMQMNGMNVTVVASPPIPNPPENVGSSSPGRGAGREGAAPRRARR